MNRNEWFDNLQEEEKRLGFKDGFKFVYGPWETLEDREIAFLSLNPGRPPDGAELRLISDERGNSYEVERNDTKSKITNQFLLLANFLKIQPIDILTGVVAPFRSNRWGELTPYARTESLALGKQFWYEPLSQPGLKLVFACSKDAADLVCEVLGATFTVDCPAAWHNKKLRRWEAPGGKVIVYLPHLSRFPLFGRPESEEAIQRIID